jgi:hypothetical protein
MDDHANSSFWRSTSGIVVIGFLMIAGFFLVTEHAAHVWGILPYALLLACPLMHLFHHHGGHGHHEGGPRPDSTESRQ